MLFLGFKEGLIYLVLVYINLGDLVLVFNFVYLVYFWGFLIVGGKVYSILLKLENDWIIDLVDIFDSVV